MIFISLPLSEGNIELQPLISTVHKPDFDCQFAKRSKDNSYIRLERSLATHLMDKKQTDFISKANTSQLIVATQNAVLGRSLSFIGV